ncbi:MAG TPA: hypothetical protein VEK10_01820 [Steroidobacteraceae bacterium]|nr:hypothetical protein [Steroidobacteraceae bacterium]
MNTTWEQLEGAALTLARSGTIKDRLADAYRNHLSQVNADELPEDVREEFRACDAALTRERPLRGEDAVRATVRKMSNQEADELACCVIRLFTAMVRESRHDESASLDEHVLNGAAAVRAKLKAVPQVIAR